MIIRILILTFFIGFNLNLFSQIRDSIYIEGDGFETYDWMNQLCLDILEDEFVDFYKKNRIDVDFRNRLVVEKDSLFIEGVSIVSREKEVSGTLKEFNKKFLKCISDTIRINVGRTIRKCLNCKNTTLFERLLIVNSGIVVADNLYTNIILNDSLLDRSSEDAVLTNILSRINAEFDWDFKLKKKEHFKYLTFEIIINRYGEIDSVIPLHSKPSPLENKITNTLKSMKNWELRLKYGALIAEKFIIKLKLDFDNKSVLATSIYVAVPDKLHE